MSEAVPDRRRASRRPFDSPVNVCTDTRKDRAGMGRDASPTGILFRSLSKFAVGERVVISFRIERDMMNATGRVVRSWRVTDPWSIFPHATAVEFDQPLAVLATAA